jgi:hypothetical protein
VRALKAACLTAIVLCAAASAAAQATAERIDIASLIREAMRNGDAMSWRMFDYSWTSKTLVRHYDKRGRMSKETVQEKEVYVTPGLSYVTQKLVRENGLPLSPQRAAKEEKRVYAELSSAGVTLPPPPDEVRAARNSVGCPAFGILTVLNGKGGKETTLGVSDFICFGEFFSPRVERREGREMVALHFRPRAGLDLPSDEKAPFAKLVGTIWIDAKDRVVARIEAWPSENPQQFKGELSARGEPAVVFDDMRLPDGMWVRRLRYVDTRKNPAAFNRLSLEWRQEFSDYKHYSAQVQDYRLDKPSTPP